MRELGLRHGKWSLDCPALVSLHTQNKLPVSPDCKFETLPGLWSTAYHHVIGQMIWAQRHGVLRVVKLAWELLTCARNTLVRLYPSPAAHADKLPFVFSRLHALWLWERPSGWHTRIYSMKQKYPEFSPNALLPVAATSEMGYCSQSIGVKLWLATFIVFYVLKSFKDEGQRYKVLCKTH